MVIWVNVLHFDIFAFNLFSDKIDINFKLFCAFMDRIDTINLVPLIVSNTNYSHTNQI